MSSDRTAKAARGCGINPASSSLLIMMKHVESRKISIHAPFFPVGIQVLCICVILCAFLVRTRANTIHALSAAYTDVSNAVAQAQTGDTVIVPAGTNFWSSGIGITNKGITIQGAGYYVYTAGSLTVSNQASSDTKIINENTSAPLFNIYFSLTNGEFFRLSGFHFNAGTTNVNSPQVANVNYYNITLSGSGNLMNNSQWRIDHCYFERLWGPNIQVGAWNGLIDNCVFFVTNNGDMVAVYGAPYDAHGNPLGDPFGNTAWANDIAYGTVDEGVCIENCFFTNNLYRGALDMFSGGKAIFRYSTLCNCAVENHGTENGQIYRGGRWMAVYGNTFIDNEGIEIAQPVYCRSGSGVCFSNTVTGPWTPTMVALVDYRMLGVFFPWGIADGVNPWDDNATNSNGTIHIFATGTCSEASPSDLVMTDPSANWTPNQWVGYSIYNTNSQLGSVISANTATTITAAASESLGSRGDVYWTNGQVFEVTLVNHSLDQPGVGRGLLLTNIPGTGTEGPVGWPQQVDDPWYIWGNTASNTTFDSSPNSVSSSPYYNIQAGRNYTTVARSGYVALSFPHPFALVGVTNAVYPPTNLRVTPLTQ